MNIQCLVCVMRTITDRMFVPLRASVSDLLIRHWPVPPLSQVTASVLIISQDCYGRVLGWNLKVIARLERKRYDERRALCAAAHLEQEEVLPGIRRHFGFYLQSILSVTIAMVQQSEWNV